MKRVDSGSLLHVATPSKHVRSEPKRSQLISSHPTCLKFVRGEVGNTHGVNVIDRAKGSARYNSQMNLDGGESDEELLERQLFAGDGRSDERSGGSSGSDTALTR